MASKNRVILLESDSGHRKLLSFNLNVYVDCDVVFKHNADATINFLKEDSDIRAIISEESVGGEQTILKIYHYSVSAGLNIPILLSGHCDKLAGKIEMYEKKNWREVVRQCAKILGVTAKQMANKDVDKYYPISTDALLAMTEAPVDIFVSGEDMNAGELLFPEGQGIDQKIVRKRLLHCEGRLFVLSRERLKFAHGFSEQVFDFIANKAISTKDRIKATGMAFEKTHEIIKTVGMSEEAVKMAKMTVESIVRIAAVSHGLSDLMDILCDSEESHLYRHGLLIAIISHQIIGDMNWGNEEQKLKIAFAAFFHDITIPNERYCRIRSRQELDDCDVPEKDKARILSHAFDAAKLLTRGSDIPFGVDTIILQHHGSLNGMGFKKGEQDERLSTLSAVFLVVEDYVDAFMDAAGESFDHDRIIGGLKRAYFHGNFGKVVAALEKIKDN